MKKEFIETMQRKMLVVLTNEQQNQLKKALEETFVELNIDQEPGASEENGNRVDLKNLFLDAKRIEGCSEKSLSYYKRTIEQLLNSIKKRPEQITTEDIRIYLMEYQQSRSSSKVTIDNIRRILSSFFAWLEAEDYIIKSPVRRIHKVKTGKVVKEIFNDEELEKMRDGCSSIRDLAIIDLLASTGMRIGEMIKLKKNDVNFTERECIVLGKGNKERIVYFDARTKIHLTNYIESRGDDSKFLFVSQMEPHLPLSSGAVECMLRKLGGRLSINKVHPHKFRRTLATNAIDKGMPIEQVQQLLGHQKIDTTLQYAMVKQQNVKQAHRKYCS